MSSERKSSLSFGDYLIVHEKINWVCYDAGSMEINFYFDEGDSALCEFSTQEKYDEACEQINAAFE